MATALSFKWDKDNSITSSYVRSSCFCQGLSSKPLSESPAAYNEEVGSDLMMVNL